MGTTFYKMTGSGNDFVFLDGREQDPAAWPAERIRAVCDRRRGVGADGLVILVPEPQHGAGYVRMVFFNSDGSAADMCGNAALCSTRLSARLGLARAEGMHLVTGAGTFPTRCSGGESEAELNLPGFLRPREMPEIERHPGEQSILLATVGVPHLTVLVSDVENLDVHGRGRQLRLHPALRPAGANINFLGPVPSPRQGSPAWALRTYERGVEGETHACGTGTVASAVAAASLGLLELPATVQSRSGLPLRVMARLTATHAEDVWLRGEGRLVFRGELVAGS
jgi:diaminopimelate epimerase